MPKKEFTKKALSEDTLVSILRKRGLIIPSENKLHRILQTIGYYRLSGYLFPFRDPSGNDTFLPNTTLDMIWDLYTFDRKLRLITMDAISRIEIGIRTIIVETHTSAYDGDPFVYVKKECFSKIKDSDFENFSNEIEKCIRHAKRSKDPSICHFLNEYELNDPPIWATMEVLSFGLIISYFSFLEKKIKETICNNFHTTPNMFNQWLHVIKRVRNICAHQGRLWNRKIDTRLSFSIDRIPELTSLHKCFLTQQKDSPLTLFTVLSLCNYLLKIIRPESEWKQRIKGYIIENTKTIFPVHMGFPVNWENLDLWK